MTRSHRTSKISLAPLFVLLMTCSVLADRLAAQDSEVSVSIQLAEQPEEGRAVSRASQGATFSVRPSVTSSSVGHGEKTLVLDLRCINNATGQIIPFCNVQLHWQARTSTGGHLHDDGSRPRGTYEPSSGNTGASGVLTTTYTSPEASGIIDNILTGQLPNGQAVNAASFTIGVEIPDLVPLGAGANYNLVGSGTEHPDNHYGTPTLNGMLRTLADSYAAAFPGQRLDYNDMSLAYGGVFDIAYTWKPDHFEHRFGQNCDLRIRTVPPQQRPRLRQLIYAVGIRGILEHKVNPHWHLTE
jgi:hypothetical protein